MYIMHEAVSTVLETPALPELMAKKVWHNQVPVRITQAEQAGEPLSVAFIDVDRFKDINDTLGHAAGDRVITDIEQVVAFVAENLRTGKEDDAPQDERRNETAAKAAAGDMVAYSQPTDEDVEKQSVHVDPGHIGGDEFAILAKVDAAGAQGLTARLRGAFSDYLELPENTELKKLGIGLSIGVATLRSGMTASELLAEADVNLYKNKLEQLPPLTEQQEAVLRLAKAAIEASDLRMRDLLKYEHLIDHES